jgi:anaerobic ribonucleoside-triphosphate reductase activating protein
LVGVRDCLGPGLRAVVWVQGCVRRCPGCIASELQPPSGGHPVDPRALAEDLLHRGELDGLTVSGGEPMDQPMALAALLRVFRDAGKSTWVYTGYSLEYLVGRDDPDVDRAIALTDVLVDGDYRQDLVALPFRGSANQRLIRLSGPPLAPPAGGWGSRVEVRVDVEGSLMVVGVPPRGFLAQLQARLGARGLVVVPDQPWVEYLEPQESEIVPESR